jgi:WD40 repeat protein
VAESVDATGDTGVIGGVDGSVTHIALADGSTLARTAQGSAPVVVALGPNREVAAASRDATGFRLSTVTVRDPDLVVTWTIPDVGTLEVTDLAFAPTGDVLAIGAAGATDPIVVNTLTQTRFGWVQIRPEIGRSASTVAVSRNGVVFATGATGIVSSFPLDQTVSSVDYIGGVGALDALALSPDGSRIWAAGGRAVGWSLAGDDTLGGSPFGVGSTPVAFSHDGTHLLARGFMTSDDAPAGATTAQLFTADSREAAGVPVVGEPIGFADNDLALVRQGDDIVLLDRFGVEVDRFTLPAASVAVVVAPSGTRIGSITADGSFAVLDARDGALIRTVEGDATEPIGAVAFGDDDTIAITRPTAGRIDLEGITSEQANDSIPISEQQGSALAFAPRRDLLAVGARDGSTTLYRLDSLEPQRTITGPNGPVNALRFTDEGSVLVIAAADGTVRRVDTESGIAIGGAFPYSGVRSTVVVDAAGSRLAGANGFGMLVFDLDASTWRKRACTLAGANLTLAEWRQFLGSTAPRPTCNEHPPPS